MKKKNLLVGLLVVTAALGLAACKKKEDKKPEDPTPPVEQQSYTVTFDSKGGSNVAKATTNADGKVAKPEDPTKTDFDFGGWFTDSECQNAFDFDTKITQDTTLYAKWTAKTPSGGGNTPSGGGNTPSGGGNTPSGGGSGSDTQEKFKVEFYVDDTLIHTESDIEAEDVIELPSIPTNLSYYRDFDGWYAEGSDTEFNESTPVEANTKLYARWNAKYETINYTLDANDIAVGSITEDLNVSKFTVSSGTENRTQSGKAYGTYNAANGIKLNSGSITIHSAGAGKVKVYLVNRLNSSVTESSVSIQGPDLTAGPQVFNVSNVLTPEYFGTVNVDDIGQVKKMYAFEFNVTAGDYVLTSADTNDVAKIEMSCSVEMSKIEGIAVVDPQTKFLLGRELDTTLLQIAVNYENGRQDIIASTADGVVVNKDAFSKTEDGEYTIDVTYTVYGMTFTTDYSVEVYKVDSLTLYDYSLNGSRVTLPLQKVFLKDSTFNSNNLVVWANCSIHDTTKTEKFLLDASEFSVSTPDLTTVDSKDVTVTFGSTTVTATYTIEVVEDTLDEASGEVKVSVNATDHSAANTFATLNDALRYLALCDLKASTVKKINVAAGEYNEKVEVNIPNVHIIGADKETTTIWFNALNGLMDPSNTTTYSTDGSATISIRESAEGFHAEKITFKNYYNTNALYVESQGIAGAGTQAVAALVQADKSVFDDVKFTSYHDTLYAQVGRQYYQNCYIEGRTDYIFGYNATALFYQCELHTLGANDAKNGGYVIATKGLKNKANEDGIKYGYVFDDCDFTADGDDIVDSNADGFITDETEAEGKTVVNPGTVSIARGWDTKMAVFVTNSDISKAYSQEAYGDTSSEKNDRYGKMNADPVASQLLEYDNRGDGAVSESKTGWTYSDSATAEEYTNPVKIFGATNGNMKYKDNWGGTVVPDVTVTLWDNDIKIGEFKEFEGNTLVEAQCVAPNKPSSVFVGWYTDKETLETEFDFGHVCTASENINLYAKYETSTAHEFDIPSAPASASEETAVDSFFWVTKDYKTESIKQSNNTYTKNDENLTFTKQISLTKGKAATNANSIKFTIAEGSATVTVYAACKSDKAGVTLSVLNSSGSAASYSNLTVDGVSQSAFTTLKTTDNSVEKFVFTLQAGTYYLGGSGGGAYIYKLVVEC